MEAYMEVFQNQKQQGKQDFWHTHIQACENSDLSQHDYCRQHSLALSTFGYWRRKIKRSTSDKPRFYPLTVTTETFSKPAYDTSIAFYLNQDRFRIEIDQGFSPALLKKLVTALEQL